MSTTSAGTVSHGFTFTFVPEVEADGNFDSGVRLIDWNYGGVSVSPVDMTDQQSKGNYGETEPGTATNAEVTMSLKMFRTSTAPKQGSKGTLTIYWPMPNDVDTPSDKFIISCRGWWSKIKELSGTHGEKVTHSVSFQPTGAVLMNEAPTP